MSKYRAPLKKIWFFLWEDDSLLSWIANFVLAIILVKFIIYPGLGLLLGTSFPIVAVVSSSMEHSADFDQWWQENKIWYEERNVGEKDFATFKNGFDKGDMMVLLGKDASEIKTGDVIVYSTQYSTNPIIHRVVSININGEHFFETKGDNNPGQLPFEKKIAHEQLLGKAVLRVPLLGWVKVIFTEFVNLWR